MILEIIKGSDNPILRKVSQPVEAITPEISELITNLADTLEHSKIGVAISAIQVGVPLRVVYMRGKIGAVKPLIAINPEIIEALGRTKQVEGCLSLPRVGVRKIRKQYVRIRYMDEHFQTQEVTLFSFDAIVIQHEIDHLNGILMTDEFNLEKK